MRLWAIVFAAIWGLIACSPSGLTPQPPPTGSPVELRIDDVEIELTSASGWQTYASDNRIILAFESDSSPEININIWIPDIDMSDYENITDVAVEIVSMMQNEQDLYVTQPTAIDWNEYNAVYFLVGNDNPNTSMIVVLDTNSDVPVALHIRGIVEEYSSIRDVLSNTFETFTVNDVHIGSDFFVGLPDRLNLPVRNPEAALDPSAEP